MRKGGATPHTAGMARSGGVMASGGRAAGKSPSSHNPLSQEHRSGGCSWTFGFWCILGSLFPQKMGTCGGTPGQARCVCLYAQMQTLFHTCNTHPYLCCQAYGIRKGIQTPFSLDKLKTQHGSFLFYLRKKHALRKERQLERASDRAGLSYPGTPHGEPVPISSPEPTVWQQIHYSSLSLSPAL